MNDERIHQLLAKAGELDRFELDLDTEVVGAEFNARLRAPSASPARAATEAPALRLAGGSRVNGRRPVWRSLALTMGSLAAAIGLAMVIFPSSPSSNVSPQPAALAKELPPYIIEFLRSVEAANHRTDRDVLLAVYEPSDASAVTASEASCLQIWTPSWTHERDMADAREVDIVGESLDHACLERPGRVTIVGLSGPADKLPQTQSQAMDLVACMMQGSANPSHQCGESDWSLSSAASHCLPDTVSVRVQTISIER